MNKIVVFLKSEPVAVWGVVLAALIGVLTTAGVGDNVTSIISGAAALLGIPVVRSKVTPWQAGQAVLNKDGTTPPVALVTPGPVVPPVTPSAS